MSSNPNTPDPNSVDLAAVRAKLAQAGQNHFWQSLEELLETKEYREFLEHEFPHDTAKNPEGIDRRDVLKLAAASAALAGLSACTKLPTEKIVPYVKPPEEIVPGKPLFYATSMQLAGVATGLLVESNMGRPTKIEGNPEHPGSLGGTDVFTQASVLTLYDPDRSQTVIHEGRISDWSTFGVAMADVRGQQSPKGTGLHILTETVTSPSLAAQISAALKQFPEAKWHQYEQCGRDNVRAGAKLAFGKPVNPIYKFDKADVIVSLDADFLTCGAGHVRYTRDFSSRRALDTPATNPNRLYVVESMPTSTGAMADHRKPVRASEIGGIAQRLAAEVGVASANGGENNSQNISADWTRAVAKDLQQHRGSSLVIAGEEQPPCVHALAHAMNASLGNVGKTVYYTDPLEVNPTNGMESLRDLANDMKAGKVDVLLMLGGNPVYDAPIDFDFGPALLNVKLRIHSGLYYDETGELCHWHVPATHYLESWGDARAYDGTIGIIQPLIAPLYQGCHSPYEITGLLGNDPGKSNHDIVRDYWASQRPEKDKAFEDFWERSLHDGVMAGTALPAINVAAGSNFAKPPAAQNTAPSASDVEISFRPDSSIFDGRFANNGWLQETPKPNTRLTWDNAAMVSPATAQRLNVTTGNYVKLQLSGRETKAGRMIVPGHADNSVTLHLGYGRRRAGKVGTGPGFNANFIRTSGAPWSATGLRVEKTGKQYYFAVTQHQYIIDHQGHGSEEASDAAFHRDLVQVATLEEFRANPNFARDPNEEATRGLTLYPGFKYEGYAWGMSIDLNKCVGCNACVVACQSENNIAVVGKEQVMAGRAMHWIRVDTYFRGGLENPEMYSEPMPCMQCEN